VLKAYNGSNFTPRPSIVFDLQEKLLGSYHVVVFSRERSSTGSNDCFVVLVVLVLVVLVVLVFYPLVI
jgi:hypothetical protein